MTVMGWTLCFFVIKTTIYFGYVGDVTNANTQCHHSSLKLVNKETLKSKYLFSQKFIFPLFYLPQSNTIELYMDQAFQFRVGNLVSVTVEQC